MTEAAAYFKKYTRVWSQSSVICTDQSDRCHLLECHFDDATGHGKLSQRELDRADLMAQLDSDEESQVAGSNHLPLLQLYVIHFDEKSKQLHFRNDLFEKLVENLSLTAASGYWQAAWAGFTQINDRHDNVVVESTTQQRQRQQTFILKCKHNQVVFWTSDSVKLRTRGILISVDKSSLTFGNHLGHLARALDLEQLRNPMFLGLAFSIDAIFRVEVALASLGDTVRHLENEIFVFSAAKYQPGDRKDFTSISYRSILLRASLAQTTYDLKVVIKLVELLADRQSTEPGTPALSWPNDLSGKANIGAIDSLLKDHRHRLDFAKLSLDRIYEDSDTVLTAISHLNVREDGFSNSESNDAMMRLTEASNSLAQLTQRDAIAMRTLALVTMLFLPGTAVATIFQMPFFNWDDHKRPTADNKLWIFWITSIPLTLLTVLVYIWVRISTEKEVKMVSSEIYSSSSETEPHTGADRDKQGQEKTSILEKASKQKTPWQNLRSRWQGKLSRDAMDRKVPEHAELPK